MGKAHGPKIRKKYYNGVQSAPKLKNGHSPRPKLKNKMASSPKTRWWWVWISSKFQEYFCQGVVNLINRIILPGFRQEEVGIFSACSILLRRISGSKPHLANRDGSFPTPRAAVWMGMGSIIEKDLMKMLVFWKRDVVGEG